MSKAILVLDDELLIALDIQSQLEELGYNVLVASGLAEALALVERHPIDMAIVDWHLREALSTPVVDLLKLRGIPFVLCSGSSLEELAKLFPTAPILTKPFASDELVSSVDRLSTQGSSIDA